MKKKASSKMGKVEKELKSHMKADKKMHKTEMKKMSKGC
jgi:hypothetical protein